MQVRLPKAGGDLMYAVYVLILVALSAVFWLPATARGSTHSHLAEEIPIPVPLPQLTTPPLPLPPPPPPPVHNPHHIFNAIHSAARQWGESLNHNGMSFFLATVPKGTLLHHGTHKPSPVTGMEWLAFEPEHALNFAWKVCDNTSSGPGIEAIVLGSHARSLHGWHGLLDALEAESGELDAIGNDDDDSDDNYDDHDTTFVSPERLALQNKLDKSRRDHGASRCIEPGFLHTYSARRPLHLLYIDGQSAGKSDKGTDDSQDYVLRHNLSSEKPPGRRPLFGDLDRAIDLCNMAQHDYNGRVDGFLRMEHGFEIVLCDFSNLDVASISRAQTVRGQGYVDPDDPVLQEQALMLMSAISARYDGLGSDRVAINYEHFVTAFAYPDADLWAQGEDLPRLNGTKSETLARIKDDVKHMVLHGRFPGEPPAHPPPNHGLQQSSSSASLAPFSDLEWRELRNLLAQSSEDERLAEMRGRSRQEVEDRPSWMKKIDSDYAKWAQRHQHDVHPPHPNWQTIADYYITRYARWLPYLVSGKFDTTARLRAVVTGLYRPYMNSSSSSSSSSTHHDHDRNAEIHRCTTAYIPHHLLSIPPHQQTLAHRTILSVAGDVCEVLWDVMDPNNDSEVDSISYDDRIAAIEALIGRLAWTEWKKCSQPACAIDEVCFTAIWPYGSQQDHDHPSCKNATAIIDHDRSMGYWFKKPPPTL